MSGHSKWHSIKHKKGAADAKRGKLFTQHAKMIVLAAQQGGGDPEMNPSLRSAIDRAKADNVPNANIDRAIKKGTGELKDGEILSEITYEGYGPGGTAIFVQAITDNKNRTLANVRSSFTKHGGNLGETGCVAWMFKKKGLIILNIEGMEMEEVEMAVIESGADDMSPESSTMEVYTAYQELGNVKKVLEQSEMKVESAEILFVAKDTVRVEDAATAKKILKLMDALEEDEDVTNVSSNFDIPEAVLEEVAG